MNTGFSQLWVDARAALGSGCRRQLIKIGLEVVPLSSADLAATKGACVRHPNKQCVFGGEWKGYGGGYCEEDGDGGCRLSQKFAAAREKKQIRTVVNSVVAF